MSLLYYNLYAVRLTLSSAYKCLRMFEILDFENIWKMETSLHFPKYFQKHTNLIVIFYKKVFIFI